MKARSRSLERKLQQNSQPKVQEQNLSTEDSRSQLSTTSIENIQSIQPEKQQQTLNNFINQGHEAWPSFTVQPQVTYAQVIEAPLQKQLPLQPPKMSLNQQNTGFSITFVTTLPKLISKVRSPYKLAYQFYHNPEDNLTYFFKITEYYRGPARNYEIDCVPKFDTSKGKKMNKHYKQAYAMRTQEAKKTRQVIQGIVVKSEERTEEKKSE